MTQTFESRTRASASKDPENPEIRLERTPLKNPYSHQSPETPSIALKEFSFCADPDVEEGVRFRRGGPKFGRTLGSWRIWGGLRVRAKGFSGLRV